MEQLTEKQKYARAYHKRNAEKIRAQKKASYHANKKTAPKKATVKKVAVKKPAVAKVETKEKVNARKLDTNTVVFSESNQKIKITEKDKSRMADRRRLEDLQLAKEMGIEPELLIN